MCRWDSQLVPCVVLLPEETSTPNPSAVPEKASTEESATTMGKSKFNKCWLEQPEFSWLKAVKSWIWSTVYALQDDPQLGHTKSEKHQLASKRLQWSHTCHQLPAQVHPVLLGPNSAPPLPSRIQATFKPSSAQTLKEEVLWIVNAVAVKSS